MASKLELKRMIVGLVASDGDYEPVCKSVCTLKEIGNSGLSSKQFNLD